MSKFYTEILGMSVVKEQTAETFVTFAAGCPRVFRKLDLLPAKRDTTIAPVGIELSLEVDDVDATWREWQAKGI